MKTQTTEEINLSILNKRLAEYNSVKGPRVGDYIKLPYGLYTRITQLWDSSVQTGGSPTGSYYFGGLCSYSGGLDPGVKREFLIPTSETKKGGIWFFSEDYHKAHNGVHFEIDCRVYTLTSDADTNGIREIAKYEEKLKEDKLPKIELFNGNGQLYSVALPKIVIQDIGNLTVLEHIEKQTGIKFNGSLGIGIMEGQPETFEQVTKLLLTYNFTTKYYNNYSYSNTLVLTFNR